MGECVKNTENEDMNSLSNSTMVDVTTSLSGRVAETIQSKIPIREDINTPEPVEDFTKLQNLCINIDGKSLDTITPEEFNLTLMNRNDVKYLDTYLNRYERFSQLSPEILLLYDKIVHIQRIQELSKKDCESFIEGLFLNITKNCDIDACMEVLPSLIYEGYDLDIIKNLCIRKDNKDIVQSLLEDKEITEILNKKSEYKIGEITKFVNVNNFQYLKDLLSLNIGLPLLSYFNCDTKEIIQKYLSGYKDDLWSIGRVLDRIHRRGHSLQSISNIFGDETITPLTERLLEFKDFDKFKNIGINDYMSLSTEDKKIFLNNFISALTPYDVQRPEQFRGYDRNFQDLQKKMKIFEELEWVVDRADPNSVKARKERLKNYNNTVRKLLNGIPDDERLAYNDNHNFISYRKEYREKNRIPPLVDDIEDTLKIRTENIKGRKVKVTELDFDTDLGVSAHKFDSILSVEALEVTDGRMLLSVGTNGGRLGSLNVALDGYALIVKPKNIWNLYAQSICDIDSGSGSMKNLYNFENVMLPLLGDHGECLSLVPKAIKQELNLSQKEYTQRIDALGNVTTLQEVGEKDKELELTIRKILKDVNMYEGLVTPTVMGISIGEIELNNVDEDILDYCVRRDIPLVKIRFQKNKQESNVNLDSWNTL